MAENDAPERPKTTNVLLAILTVIAVAFALRETASVTLPIAFAIFLVALHWPLQRRLVAIMPRGAAVAISLIVFLAVTTGFGWVLLESADEVKDDSSRYAPQVESMIATTKEWLSQKGIEVGGQSGGGDALRRFAAGVSRAAVDLLGGFVLVLGFLGLGLLEVRDVKKKLRAGVRSRREEGHWSLVMKRIGTQFQRYVVVRTVIGVITGVACGLGGALMGLDYWFIWGLLSFLLNYIPTIGSVVAVVPPVAFAWFQFQDPMMALVALAIFGGVQLLLGNWIDPLIQGKYLRLSPFIVLLSVTFWGWVWGIPGALIGVPLTIGAMLVCREFESTRWIALMLSDAESAEPEGGGAVFDDAGEPRELRKGSKGVEGGTAHDPDDVDQERIRGAREEFHGAR